MTERCLDCDAPLAGPYCQACGQKAGPARVTLGTLVGQLVGETFELDGRVPRTLVPFVLRPGELTREYNAGRRTRYTAPLRLLLGMGALWVLVAFSISQWQALNPRPPAPTARIQLDDPDAPGSMVRAVGLDGSRVGEVLARRIQAFEALPEPEQIKKVRSAASDVPPTVAFLLLPVAALFLAPIFVGSRRTIPQHATFAMHLHAFGLLLAVVVRVVGTDALIPIAFTWFMVYVLLALRRAYDLTWAGALWRWFLVGTFYTVVSTLTFALAVLGTALGE